MQDNDLAPSPRHGPSARRWPRLLLVGCLVVLVGVGGEASAADRALVREVQALLAERGYDPGPADGVAGAGTRAAVARFQSDQGLRADGEITAALRDRLRGAAPVAAAAPPYDERLAVGEGEPGQVLQDVQVRAGPDPLARVVGRLPAGSAVQVLELSGPGARVVASGGMDGWVPASRVRIAAAAGSASGGGSAGGGSSLLRALTGLVGGGGQATEQRTVTTGVRGLRAEDLANARPDIGAVDALERHRVDDGAARGHARSAGLVARRVDYLEGS